MSRRSRKAAPARRSRKAPPARIQHVILFARDLPGLLAFYRDVVGIAAREVAEDWVELDTAGCTLALHALAEDGEPADAQVSFGVDDLDATVAAITAREPFLPLLAQQQPWGKVAHFRDLEGIPLALHQPSRPWRPGRGPRLSTVILNCRDLGRARHFYRDTLGLTPRVDTEHWVDFDLGGVTLGLHPWMAGAHGARSAEPRRVLFGFETPRLHAWFGELRGRGAGVVMEPRPEMGGLLAEIEDPVGNVVMLYQPVAAAEAARAGKAAAAVSERRPPAAKPATSWRSAKVKAARVPLRPKERPATGRLRKAERRTLKRASTGRAQASRGRPVKRAAAGRSRSGR